MKVIVAWAIIVGWAVLISARRFVRRNVAAMCGKERAK